MSISYADRGGTKGYQVRVTRNGKCYTKFFSARIRGAKKKAQEYEQKLLELLGPSSTSGRGRKRPVRTNTGARYITETIGRYGTACVRVTFRQENGHWASRDISVEKHGRTKALRLAKQMHLERHIPANREDRGRTPSPEQVRRALADRR